MKLQLWLLQPEVKVSDTDDDIADIMKKSLTRQVLAGLT